MMDIKSVIKNLFQNIKSLFPYIKKFRFIEMFSLIVHQIDYHINIRTLNKREVIRKVNNYPMILNFDEEGLSKHLMILRKREISETKTIKEIVKPGMCILDIGANIGYYTVLVGKLVGKNGKVYAYEPYPPSVEILVRNVKLNKLIDIVEVQNLAVSSRNTTQKLYLGKASNVHSLTNLKTDNSDVNYIEVKTKDIQEILTNTNRKIDLIRMDIEGHERELFNRLSKDISQFLPNRIFFEVHPLGDIDPDPTFINPLTNVLSLDYYPELVISSSNVNAKERFEALNYYPSKIIDLCVSERYLYNNIKPCDLLKVAASRPKMTRAVLLKRKV